MGAPASRLDDEVRPGLVIADRYRLERPIGTGGMATIWEATHLTLARSVALKFVSVTGVSPAKIRARFLREARVAAAIQHRNVVDIVDFGTTDDGRPFMAMELLVGSTLAERMERSALGSAEAVRILAQVLSGLAAVHDAGIVHRDLKPENVFLAEDADGAIAKLIDFGVSRALDRKRGLTSVLPTLENVIVGTPQYMSPEQARGLAHIDQRSDLWSAGVMLFELLTGTLPFDADAVGDVIIQIATKEPPALSSRRPDLEGPLAEVVRRAMQRDPADRFSSAREMRNALLCAVTDTAAMIRAAPGCAPETAEELLGAVDDAYEPGDSALIQLAHLRGAARPRPPSAETISPRKPSRLRVIVPALMLAILALMAAGAYAAREPAPPPRTAAPPRAPEIVAPPIEPPVVELPPPIVEPAPPPPPRRRARPQRANGLFRSPGF